MKERVIWTVLLGVATGASAYLAAKAAERVWTGMTGTTPPKPLAPLGMLGKRTGEGMAERFLH